MCVFTLNPRFLIIWLIMLRILIRRIFLFILNSWTRYAIILLFTGGIIVLFSYILSLVVSSKIKFFSSIKLVVMFWLIIIIFNSREICLRSLIITNLFSNSRNITLIILALYLLIVLLTIVNIASSNTGPIKSFFYYDQQ